MPEIAPDDSIRDLTGAEPPGVLSGLTREEREDEFFRLLRAGCTVRAAAAAVAVDWSHLYRKRRDEPEFARRWETATRIQVTHLIAEAERRAMRGSDKLLMFLLERYDPVRFGKRESIDLTNSDGSLRAEPEDGDAAARTAALLATARARKQAAETMRLEREFGDLL